MMLIHMVLAVWLTDYRATVHDGSVHAWGLNEQSEDRMGLVSAADNRLRA